MGEAHHGNPSLPARLPRLPTGGSPLKSEIERLAERYNVADAEWQKLRSRHVVPLALARRIHGARQKARRLLDLVYTDNPQPLT